MVDNLSHQSMKFGGGIGQRSRGRGTEGGKKRNWEE